MGRLFSCPEIRYARTYTAAAAIRAGSWERVGGELGESWENVGARCFR